MILVDPVRWNSQAPGYSFSSSNKSSDRRRGYFLKSLRGSPLLCAANSCSYYQYCKSDRGGEAPFYTEKTYQYSYQGGTCAEKNIFEIVWDILVRHFSQPLWKLRKTADYGFHVYTSEHEGVWCPCREGNGFLNQVCANSFHFILCSLSYVQNQVCTCSMYM